MHRCSYNRGRQQQCQVLPQRGPTQSEDHSRNPSRSPSRCVSPLLSLSQPWHRDEPLHHSFSYLYLQPHKQEPLEEGVELTQPEIALAHTAGHSCSPQESLVECPPRSPMWKQVQFNLADNLGNELQLPPDLAGFLEWPEDATDDWGDAQSPSTPMATCPPKWPEMTMPKRESDQWCSTTAMEARPKSGTTSSTGSTTASGAKPKCDTMLGQGVCCRDEGTT